VIGRIEKYHVSRSVTGKDLLPERYRPSEAWKKQKRRIGGDSAPKNRRQQYDNNTRAKSELKMHDTCRDEKIDPS
jgi:hypothetical protein